MPTGRPVSSATGAAVLLALSRSEEMITSGASAATEGAAAAA